MKILFEFDTNSEDFYTNGDDVKLYNIQNVDNMATCLSKLRDSIRSLIKWDERETIPKDEIEEKFYEIIEDYHINFERMGY